MECPLCAQEVARDQRYCLSCGGPCAPSVVDWRAVLGLAHAPVPYAPVEPGLDAVPVQLWTWPSPRTSAALVLGMLAFGVAVGGASGVSDAVADSPRYVIVQNAPSAVGEAVAEAPEVPEESLAADVAGTEEPSTESSAPVQDTAPATEQAPSASKKKEVDTSVDTESPALPPVTNAWIVVLGGPDPQSTYLSQTLSDAALPLAGYAQSAPGSQLGSALIGGRKDDVQSYAAADHTLVDRLIERGRSWKAYIDPPAGQVDPAGRCSGAAASDPLNPFLRFASVTTLPGCAESIVPLAQLSTDLAAKEAVPTLSYLALGTDATGVPVAPEPTISAITGSAAFKQSGLLVVVEPAAEGSPGRAWIKTPYTDTAAATAEKVSEFTLTRTIEELFGLEPLNTEATANVEPLATETLGTWPDSTAKQ